MHAQHDIVIVGGGLVGASLAIALENRGLDVAMLEAAPPGALPPVFDERNLSLAEASCHALQALQVWPLLHTASPIRRIHATRSGDFGRVVLDSAETGREAFGHVVIARDFGQALETRLGDVASLTRYLAAELGSKNIRVNTPAIGWTMSAPARAWLEGQAAQGGPSVDETVAGISATMAR